MDFINGTSVLYVNGIGEGCVISKKIEETGMWIVMFYII